MKLNRRELFGAVVGGVMAARGVSAQTTEPAATLDYHTFKSEDITRATYKFWLSQSAPSPQNYEHLRRMMREMYATCSQGRA